MKNKERALEEAQEKHEAEIKVFNEKIKHLIYEHECRLTEVKAENMVALKVAQEEYQRQEAKLLEEKEQLRREMVQNDLTHEEELRTVQKNHSEELFGLRTDFMKKLEEMAIKSEKRLQTIRNYYENKNKVEVVRITESKNEIVHSLQTNHAKDIEEMRTYYKGITDNNLLLISSLQDELKQFKSENFKLKNTVEKLRKENKTMTEPLAEAKIKMKNLERQVEDMKNAKSSLFNIHKRFAVLQKKYDDLLVEKDATDIKFEKAESEKENIKTDYASMIVDIKRKYTAEIGKLEKKILFFEKEFERKEIQAGLLIQKTSTDPKTLMYATNKLQQAMVKREKKMEKLQIELCKLAKAHDELLQKISDLAVTHKIPKEEITHTPYQPVLQKFISEISKEKLFDFNFSEIQLVKDEEDIEDM